MKKLIEYGLYVVIVSIIFFILANYKYQPSLSADEFEAIDRVEKLTVVQEDFVKQNESELRHIDLSEYNIDHGYSELLLLIQELLDVVAVSGYYNEETEQAIREIQQMNGLEVTGKLEEETFALVMQDALPLSVDDLQNRGNLVRLFQRGLNLQEDGVFGEHTREAIVQLKEDLEADPSTFIDETVMNYVIEQLNS